MALLPSVHGFIISKLESADYLSHILRARRVGIEDAEVAYLAKTFSTLYYMRYGVRPGPDTEFKAAVREHLEDRLWSTK